MSLSNLEKIETLFQQLKEKNIVTWGTGKYFKNHTYPFLRVSGLEKNHLGDVSQLNLRELDPKKTVVILAVTGYQEIQKQLEQDKDLRKFKAFSSMFLEALFEDYQMLTGPKAPVGYRKNDTQRIPKVIHTFWISGDEIHGKYKKCLDSWKKYAPDYEIKIWDLNTYHAENCLYFKQAVESKMWAFATDYARADIIRREGGIYMDLDVEMLRPIDDLLYNDGYMSFESLDRIECGSGMGAGAGNQIMEEICQSYEESSFIKEDGSFDLSTCPVRFTKVIEKHGLIKNGGFQFVDNFTVYPFEVLTGKSFDTGIIYQTELSYTLHHHNGSWVPASAKAALLERYERIEEFLNKYDFS